ncbi:hypothetical protein LguiB_000117 [Lonicera macranthoides]
MALLHHLFTTTTPSRSASLSSSSLAASNSFTRLHKKSIGLNQKLFNGPQVYTPIKLKDRSAVIVKSSSDVGTGAVPEPPSKSKPEGVAVQDLPLEFEIKLTRLLGFFLLKINNQEQELAETICKLYGYSSFLPKEARDDLMDDWLMFLLEREASKEAQ